jgi:mannosyltransferase OCH1-like enzyme
VGFASIADCENGLLMISRILHQTAATRYLTWEERALLNKARKLLPDWNYTLWTDDDIRAVMQRNFACYIDTFLQIKRGIVVADIGRYAALYEQGGIYLDTDYKLIRAPEQYLDAACLLPIEEGIIERSQETDAFKLGNAFLGSIPRHDFWKDFLAHIFTTMSIDELNNGNPVATTGPIALTDFWRRHRMQYPDITLPPKAEFYPALAGLNFSFARTPDTMGVHLCWGSWRGKHSLQKYKNIIRRKITGLL